MPFSTYIDYNCGGAGLYDQFSFQNSYTVSSSESLFTSLIVNTGASYTFSAEATNSYTHSDAVTRNFLGGTNENDGSQTIDTMGYVPSVGFSYQNGTSYTTIYFSDTDITPILLSQSTSSETNSALDIKSTTQQTLTTSIDTISTTWTDIEQALSNTNIQYTDIVFKENCSIGIYDIDTLNSFSGQTINLCATCGTNWTFGTSDIQTVQCLLNTGSVFYSNGVKQCETDSPFSVEAITELLGGNVNSPASASTTIFNQSNITITYEYTDYNQTSTIPVSSNTIQFDVNKFIIDSTAQTQLSFTKKAIFSSTLSYNVSPLASYDPIQSYGNRNIYTDTKVISALSTDTFYCIDSYYSYFSSFTYSGLVTSTTISSYILFDYGAYGSYSESTSYETQTSTAEGNEIGSFTESGGTTYFSSKSESYAKISTIAYKSYYSIPLGASNDEWQKFYTKKVGNSNFVVADSNTVNKFRYFKSIGPTANLTKCYFSQYFYERNGAGDIAEFYIPISTYLDEGTRTIIHSVTVPSGYYFGNDSATIQITTFESASSSTDSAVISYGGSESLCSMGFDNVNDFSTFQSPPFSPNKIFHTEPSFYSGSWKKDGYYYYNSESRTYSGTANNAISVDGDGIYKTFIASQYVLTTAFPVVFISGFYTNSF